MATETLPISVILPTYNRAHTLAITLPGYLALPVAEIIIVDDGSTDELPALLDTFEDPRLRTVRNEPRRFLPAARNVGIRVANQPYILMGEDDVIMDASYVRVLFERLHELKADVIAGRLIGMERGEDTATALARSNEENPNKLIHAASLSGDYSCRFPEPVDTPLLHACSLYRRELALEEPYHEGYRGNSLREESDFYLRLHAAGKRLCFCSEATAFHMYHDYGGGCRTGVFKYPLSAIGNNHKFLNRQWVTLKEALDIHAPRGVYELRLAMSVVRNHSLQLLKVYFPLVHGFAKRLYRLLKRQ